MAPRLEISFAPLNAPLEPTAVVLAGTDVAFGPAARRLNEAANGVIRLAAEAASFKGKARATIELLAAHATLPPRLIVVGTGGPKDFSDLHWLNVGGVAAGQIAARKCDSASLLVDPADRGDKSAAQIAADLALGALLRSYKFDKYLTKPSGDEANGKGNGKSGGLQRLTLHVDQPGTAQELFASRQAIADGVALARDLVNEPANVLGPLEFAEHVKALTKVGVEVEILEPEALEKIGMRALLGVAMGSARGARVGVMHWHGGKSKRTKPLCFIGKGVVFDTGGISMKPAAGMEDMKGDMAGAACVTGLMHALAARKAPVNAIGIVGLVENMPSGTSQRPGDIVTSLSGQTIEVLNTDAEGRLVLCDLLTWAEQRFKPRFMINLATLTGAIMVALGKENAGLFSNNDDLARELFKAGEATGEKVWRMPLDRAYDKLIDSKNADMKNIGGRFGGAITAAQFLQRFVKDTPWAHLDIAGTAMDSPKTDISQGWASGWGVRLLDRLVADDYE